MIIMHTSTSRTPAAARVGSTTASDCYTRFTLAAAGLLVGMIASCDAALAPPNPEPIRQLASGLHLPYQLVVDREYIYLTNSNTQITPAGTILRVRKSDGARQVLAANRDFPRGIVVDNNAVYWIDSGSQVDTGQLMRVAKTGGEPAVLATGLYESVELEADDESLYFNDSVSVQRVPKHGGPPEIVIDTHQRLGTIAIAIALDEQRVYFAASGGAISGCGDLGSMDHSRFFICSSTKTGHDIRTLGSMNGFYSSFHVHSC
jgi:hypothetical protein